jgi:ubiquinone/menaquinone biosynthesis C-methylase UbiE
MNQQRNFFENLALTWDATQPPNRAEIFDRLLAPFDPYLAGGSLLEVGAGTGALIPVLYRRYPGIRLCSIDLARAMLVKASQTTPLVQVAQSDVHRLPFSGQAFSAVICHNSFPHFGDKPFALAEIRRVLRPGGHVLILHNLPRLKVNAIHQNALSEVIHHDLLPTGAELAEMLQAAGFEPRVVEDTPEHYTVCAKKTL